ncbi:hypothetical protein HYE67_006143 [Fusarium culmorum]|uniref:Uncharacterized protein n=2 Tax=Fusarium culmorum TaxID=5516 RepID=A0A7S8HWD2_FUSCU|nr:hypothetical protein HYE67_006143 [Fusarium culmorum]
MAFSNPYPADVAGIDRQAVENMIFDDFVNHDYNRKTKITLLLCMQFLQDKISDDEDYWAQIEGNEEWEKAQKEARYKIARAAIDAWKAKRDNPKKEEEEEEEIEEEAEEEEDEESEEEEEDYEEEYDDEEEETEESEGSEESGDEESDDGSDWDSLFLLVHNMPTENDEPKSTARKRSLPRDDTPCPPPRPQPAKRQRLDPSAASKAPMAQDSGNDEPKPATRKRGLIAQQNGDTPAAEVPFPKRQRMDPPALVANANDEDQEQEQGQETKSSVPSEWLAPHQEELQNSQLPEPLRGILGRLPVSELHREAQIFLLGLKYLDPADDALAKAAIDMGLRFSKTAKSSEYNIVLDNMLKHPIQAVMYNCCREDETYHTFFWGKIRSVTGRDVPPERIRERRERRAKREAEAMARFNARKAAEEAKRESQMLKEKYVSQIGEASKLPLREKVGRWLAEIVKAEKQQ